ncbi:VOC family protein [Subtercola lobariae]|uniref:Glyoxalase n=1 Tax=Subtercola lobariae TaxID=1588641 RepID=A0A917EXN7_9MICO|nr:VOC family protein [Subtercola lobariae]GGF31739.1 glyoxalase [Subtercola lobariae]
MTNHTSRPSTIERAGYLAVHSPDPAAAAAFAVKYMGLWLVHVDDEGRHYLAASGLDPYSLVFTPGAAKTIDHVAYLVRDLGVLNEYEQLLRSKGVAVERIDASGLWRAAAALRVQSPAGHYVHLTTGVNVEHPMGAIVVPNRPAPTPITLDHAAPRILDPQAEIDFAVDVLDLKVTARIVHPEEGIAVAFMRAHTLYHCYTIVAGPYNGLHHYQFTLKDRFAIFDAYERISGSGDVNVLWGPLRHGAGHNVAFYFHDHDGNIVEYSAEEEIVLDAAGYIQQEWSALNPAVGDEWGTEPPAIFFA